MKTVAKNRKARFDYDIGETYEAGLVLTGQEVKACRQGHIDLAGAYVSFLGGKAVLKQAKITKYAYAGPLPEYDPARDRALLLTKGELAKLETLSSERGSTLIPLEVRAGRYIKLVLAVAKGRKTIDKRQRIKEREVEKRLKQQGDY